MIKVSIIGASGYTGSELIRLLVNHPEVSLQHLTSRSLAGQSVGQHFPAFFSNLADKYFSQVDLEAIKSDSDLVFICLPHGHSMEMVKKLGDEVKVIDLGADFRLDDVAVYEETYQIKQAAPDILEEAVYGLSEYYREDLKQARVVANPGCFVTNALLALTPLIQSGWIDPQSIIIDSKTGLSGAGKSANVDNLLTEMGNSFKAYNPFNHRHIPEIEQELNKWSDNQVEVQFTPHLLPTERGIFSTIYCDYDNDSSLDANQLHSLYEDFYQDDVFIQVLPKGMLPDLKAVRGSNYVQVQVDLDPRTGRILIFSVLDNLMKGASGQAVQNMNIMYGFEESLGLEQVGMVP